MSPHPRRLAFGRSGTLPILQPSLLRGECRASVLIQRMPVQRCRSTGELGQVTAPSAAHLVEASRWKRCDGGVHPVLNLEEVHWSLLACKRWRVVGAGEWRAQVAAEIKVRSAAYLADGDQPLHQRPPVACSSRYCRLHHAIELVWVTD